MIRAYGREIIALMNNKEEGVDSFFGFIDFENYADKHHHGKRRTDFVQIYDGEI